MTRRLAMTAGAALAAAVVADVAVGAELSGLELSGDDWSVRPVGRIQLDATGAEADFDGASDSWTDSEVRRAWLGAAGHVGRFRLAAQANFAEGGDVDLTEAGIELDAGGLTFKAGHIKPPASINWVTSSRYPTSMENAAFVSAFNMSYRLGTTVTRQSEAYVVTAGVFGSNANEDLPAAQKGLVAAVRGVWLPVREEGRTLHLAASAMRREARDGDLFRYRARPLINQSDRFIDAGAFADEDAFLGLEAVYMSGPLYAAAELARLEADGPGAGGSDAEAVFDGAYVEAGWFLTPGDARGYQGGVFSRTRPVQPVTEGGMGAWELRGRLDRVDLSDGPTPGGRQTGVTVGVNWFATDTVRMLAEYTDADIDDGPQGDGDVRAFSMRLQVDW